MGQFGVEEKGDFAYYVFSEKLVANGTGFCRGQDREQLQQVDKRRYSYLVSD